MGRSFRGALTDLRVWSAARTDAQIAAAMKRRVAPTETHLVGCWPLDDRATLLRAASVQGLGAGVASGLS